MTLIWVRNKLELFRTLYLSLSLDKVQKIELASLQN